MRPQVEVENVQGVQEGDRVSDGDCDFQFLRVCQLGLLQQRLQGLTTLHLRNQKVRALVLDDGDDTAEVAVNVGRRAERVLNRTKRARSL
jgi:hypothetical protein